MLKITISTTTPSRLDNNNQGDASSRVRAGDIIFKMKLMYLAMLFVKFLVR